MVGISISRDNFSFEKKPANEPVLSNEYANKNIINGKIEIPKDFLQTGKDIARY